MFLRRISLSIAAAFLSLSLAFPAGAEAQVAAADSLPAIDWKVSERFRLFSEAGSDAWRRLDPLLERIAASDPAAGLAQHRAAFLEVLAFENGASLRASNYRSVGRDGSRGSGRYRRDYLYPASYRITARVADDRIAASRCRWTTPSDTAEAGCREEVSIRVGPGRRLGEDWIVETQLRISIDGGPERSFDIRFADTLVVALGDSFISGEGNPDVPSVVTDLPLPAFDRAGWGSRLRETDYRRAVWWDEPCHRTLLSWPVLATLAYSARRPREAVTLVHLGCSGAAVADLIERGEVDLPGGGDELVGETQLAQLDRLLAAAPPGSEERRPNRILLSIGGNDSGFVGVLKTIVLPPGGYTIPVVGPIVIGRFAGAICPYRDSGIQLERLCGHAVSAQTRLEERLPDAYDRLAGKLSRRGATRIYQFAYPNPISAPDGGVCDIRATRSPSRPEEMSGFEAFMGEIPRLFHGRRFTWDFELQYFPERHLFEGRRLLPGVRCDRLTEPEDSEVCQALWVYVTLNERVGENEARPGWTVIDSHVGAISGHGICARDPGGEFLPALPWVRNGQWLGGWTPQRYLPYHADNPRWFRMPNDSIVTQYGDPDHYYHGSFHPTFSAHLAYADAALNEALADQAD